MSQKSSGLAAVLSFFLTGLGQIYNGHILKGIILMLIQLINAALTVILIGYLFMPIVWLYGVINAYTAAERHNRRNQRR